MRIRVEGKGRLGCVRERWREERHYGLYHFITSFRGSFFQVETCLSPSMISLGRGDAVALRYNKVVI